MIIQTAHSWVRPGGSFVDRLKQHPSTAGGGDQCGVKVESVCWMRGCEATARREGPGYRPGGTDLGRWS